MHTQALEQEIIIERDGRPLLAIIPYENYIALKEELEYLRDSLAAAEALDEIGRDPSSVETWEDTKVELRAAGLLGD